MTSHETEKSAPRAAIYTRISLDRSGEGEGVERQEKLCRQLAEFHGCTIVTNAEGEVFSDNSTSAYKGVEREGFEALCELVRVGGVDRVYVYSTDRLARRTRDLLNWVELAKPHRVTVHAVTGEGIDPSSANGVFVSTILGAVAEQESAHKAERIRAAYEQRAAKGRPKAGGRRMFGYEADGVTVVEAEAAALKEAVEDTIQGTRSLRQICTDWRAAGITSTTGRKMSPATLRTTLRNPYITALSTFTPTDARGIRLVKNREVVAEGTWPAIIARDTWDRLQRALDRPDRRTNRVGNTPRRLCSGLIYCTCGEPMYHRTRKLKSGGTFSYYACKKTRIEVPLPHVSIGANETDLRVADVLIGRLKRTDIAAALAALASDDGQAARLTQAVAERDDALRRRGELEAAYARGEVALDTLTRTSTTIGELLTVAEDRIAALSQAAHASPLIALVGVPDIEVWWRETATLEQQRLILADLVAVHVGPGRAGAKKHDPHRLTWEWK